MFGISHKKEHNFVSYDFIRIFVDIMINVGITGNRYSGKDRITKLFEQISIPVFNADVVLKFILLYNLKLGKQIRSEIGDSVYDSIGHLNPNEFKSTSQFNELLDIVEGDLFKAYDKFKLKHKFSIYSIFHSSILFERGWDRKMDCTISVFTPKSERIKRAQIQEPKLIGSLIWDLSSKEMDELEKNKLSNYIIHNYEGTVDVLKQVDSIDMQIIDNFLKSEQTVKSKKQILL